MAVNSATLSKKDAEEAHEKMVRQKAAERVAKAKAKADREEAARKAPANSSTYRRAKAQLKKLEDDLREGRRPGDATKELGKLRTAIANFDRAFAQQRKAENKRTRPRAKRKRTASASK